VNWILIVKVAVGLILADVFVGFVGGGATDGSLEAAKQQLVVNNLLSFGLYVAIFAVMATFQVYRPFVHACVALLVNFLLLSALEAILPVSWSGTPLVLVALGWLTAILALLVGTLLGHFLSRTRLRFVARRSARRVPADT
jgi:hypothetical protein